MKFGSKTLSNNMLQVSDLKTDNDSAEKARKRSSEYQKDGPKGINSQLNRSKVPRIFASTRQLKLDASEAQHSDPQLAATSE